jgi:hypothetical protein
MPIEKQIIFKPRNKPSSYETVPVPSFKYVDRVY